MFKVIKEYPRRGPLQQVRLEKAAAFVCFRCGRPKKAKLRTIYAGDGNKLLCNGCYGKLLSVYDIKAGTLSTDEKAAELAKVLLKFATDSEARAAAAQLLVAEERARHLSAPTLRFLGTSEHVATGLLGHNDVDWSPAIIGLCKSVELEVVGRLIDPLQTACLGADLSTDIKDRDIGRIAKYCAGRGRPPEMGVVAHFLKTAVNSQRRAGTSVLLGKLRELIRDWPRSSWLLSDDGLLGFLIGVTTSYRNPAVHIGELNAEQYSTCREMVVGEQGGLWQLISATTGR